MVLSNKKLKQKLRDELLSKALNESAPKNDPDANSKPESLRTLFNSVTQKPRLSKREKRRKVLSFDGSEELTKKPEESQNDKGSEVDGRTNEEKKRKKEKKKESRKRKREEEGTVAVRELESSEQKNKQNKKRKKKKQQQQRQNQSEVEEVVETDNANESQVNADASTKIYVGGIPYSYTEEDIRCYFKSCGNIVGVDCMQFPDSGKFRGIAIISFETEAAAKKALVFDRAEMGGLQLTIQPYKSIRTNRTSGFAPKMVEGYNRVYVGNLSWDITEDDLKKLFSDCSISSIRFGMNKETGEFRGYAHVDFSDSVSAAMALKLDQEYVCGRPVKISCAVPPKGGKPRTKAQPDDKANKEVKSHSTPLPISNEVSNVAVAPTNAKIRRRTCYECGEKGHLSSACPKKQHVDPAKANTASYNIVD